MPATRFVNDRRPCGRTVEGFGEYRTTWVDYELKCSCGKWFKGGSDVSEQVGDDENAHAWLCPACAAAVLAEWDTPAMV